MPSFLSPSALSPRPRVATPASPRRARPSRISASAAQTTKTAAETATDSTRQKSNPISGVAAALADVASRATAALRLPRPRHFPPGPAQDVAPSFLMDPLGTLESLEARYGGVVGVTLGGERVVIVGGGSDGRRAAADVLLLDPRGSFAKKGTAFFPGSDVTGNGLLTSDGDSWRRQRALATPAFRRAAVEGYGRAMASEAEATAAGVWRSRSVQARDLYRDFNALTLRVVTTALFGYDVSENDEGARIASAVDAAFARFAAAGVLGGSGSSGSELILSLLPQWFPFSGGGGGGGGGGGKGNKNAFERAVADLDDVVYEIIASRRRKMLSTKDDGGGGDDDDDDDKNDGGGDDSGSAAPCLLDAMLRARDEATGESMSDAQLRDELLTMLVAGQETSAAVLSWSAALLAHHPRVQEEVIAEVDAVFGDSDGEEEEEEEEEEERETESSSLTSSSSSSTCSRRRRRRRRPLRPSDAGSFPRLEAVLLESMRLLPPAYIVGRHARDGALISRGGRGVGAAGAKKEKKTKRGSSGDDDVDVDDANDDDDDDSATSSSPDKFWRLPPKTSVLVSPYLLHRDAEAWGPHPRRFLPFERWLPLLLRGAGGGGEGNSNGRNGGGGNGPGGLRSMPLLAGLGPNGCYVPFGAGPRVCIGASFAMLEGVLVLAALLRVARLRPVSDDRGDNGDDDDDGGENDGGGDGKKGGANASRFPAAEPRLTLRPASSGVRLRLIPRR